MTNSISSVRPGEFELIRKLFAPLSSGLPGAFGLTDDVAVLSSPAGHEVILKTDAVIEGVHFHKSDPPETIAKKALRVNISDFAAKGAAPHAYLLALGLPDWPDSSWLGQFVGGLAEDQAEFNVTLVGGDTDRTPGTLTIAVMMTGFVPAGTLIRRNGAAVGDIVYVTGAIGDAGGGLELLRAATPNQTEWKAELISRYHVPRPRLAFGQLLRGIASASLDVSDGLIADCGHIAEASNVRIEIDARRVPLSAALTQLSGDGLAAVVNAVTAGDDYEIGFTASATQRKAIVKAAERSNTQVTEIGRVTAGSGVVLLDAEGGEVLLPREGYTHF